ncbi:MAG: hypothetical protein PHD57_01785 [Desulfobacterales bacterium]|nr:hypothetical protein [Desulfobacterales bacterium]MDD3081154.1 hypothetical protein [Desulfobacterales bacterium]MDD3950538.1 hypothetical protein [Desulfobacterales bacterium]MDD4462916.1 hypothetical protein [Desulfobacterales bacterium]
MKKAAPAFIRLIPAWFQYEEVQTMKESKERSHRLDSGAEDSVCFIHFQGSVL